MRAVLRKAMFVVTVLCISRAAGAETMTFSAACKPGKRIVIAAVGDLLFHNSLQQRALSRKSGFRPFWKPVARVIADADIAYANLEGPTAQGVAAGGRKMRDPGRRVDRRVYGYRLPYLSFNYHPSLLSDLLTAGFDVVSTANNHGLDRGALGVDRTIDNLDGIKLSFTGTRSRKDMSRAWSTVVEARGISVAWLACTYSTNGIPDRNGQVLFCYKQRDEVLKEIARLTADPKIDAVILTPHWGNENSHHPNPRQRQLARAAIDAGAAAVIGAHPHVLQPWTTYVTEHDREGFIAYSLGNFVSNQRRLPQRVGLVLLLQLVKVGQAKAEVAAAGYIPTWVSIGNEHQVGEAPDRSWAMKHSKRILPSGNQVTRETWQALPRSCRVSSSNENVNIKGRAATDDSIGQVATSEIPATYAVADSVGRDAFDASRVADIAPLQSWGETPKRVEATQKPSLDSPSEPTLKLAKTSTAEINIGAYLKPEGEIYLPLPERSPRASQEQTTSAPHAGIQVRLKVNKSNGAMKRRRAKGKRRKVRRSSKSQRAKPLPAKWQVERAGEV